MKKALESREILGKRALNQKIGVFKLNGCIANLLVFFKLE